jgi:hypothetical protein
MDIKVLSIESLIADQMALGRDKDTAAIRLLEAVLSRQSGS